MVIHLKSNIFLPGLEGRESVELDRPAVSVGQFLEELSVMAGARNVRYVKDSAADIEDDWEVRVNDVELHLCGGLDSALNDGDTVAVNMLIVGGG